MVEVDSLSLRISNVQCFSDPSLELQLPSEQKMVDGLVLLNADYVGQLWGNYSEEGRLRRLWDNLRSTRDTRADGCIRGSDPQLVPCS